MKIAILGAAITAALTISAHATSFLYSGALDTYTVQDSGIYEFTVAGAQGGWDAIGAPALDFCCGGGGALISGNIYLDAGTVLTILSGGAGSSTVKGDGGSGASGGGMSFIAVGTTPLVVAGGGGGTARFGTSAVAGQIETGNGQGGTSATSNQGGAGAGWLSDAGTALATTAGSGGKSGQSFDGGAGYVGDATHHGPGNDGGFGGGGGGGYGTGGGGGGYTGGAPGGGGGGSFIDTSVTNLVAIVGGNFVQAVTPANGYVNLTFLSAAAGAVSGVPEPSAWAMFLFGFGLIGMAKRRYRLLPGQ